MRCAPVYACLLVCLLVCLGLAACGFPDYGFAPPGHLRRDAGARDAGGPVTDARAQGGRSGSGGAGGRAGGGGGFLADARSDAPTGCSGDADCAGAPAGRHCDPADRTCVECRPGGTDCPTGTRCSGRRLCEPGCDTSADCVGAGPSRAPLEAGVAAPDAQAPDGGASVTCDLATHSCVGCRHDPDCPLGTLCGAGTLRCEPGCTADRACPGGFDCCSGECVNLLRTTTHCGACSVSCARDGGLGACVGGSCRSLTCQAEFGDCNHNPNDGCEKPLLGDPLNCGACAVVCPTPRNATAICSSGVCGAGACQPGFADCDRDPANACEVNLGFSTGNCGTCGFVCNLLNANQRCQNSACELTNCRAGFADCDRLSSTGCEVNTQSDPSNCGSCGKACAFPSADATCQGGACKLGPCLAATEDCNRIAADGCEVNTNSDATNCGACARPCTLAHAKAACSDGVCSVSACDPGWGDCDGLPLNGCETSLDTSVGNCSACGVACNANHGTPSCALGACSIQCGGGFADCDVDAANGCETTTATNIEHCGSCPNVCSAVGGTPNCVGGTCGLSNCVAGRADCNRNPGDLCEVDTTSSVTNCGGCGKTCFVANGTPACTLATCTIAACTTGFGACDVDPDNGCETRLNTTTHCGACNTPCSLPHATATCVTGSCAVGFCTTPFADCDGIASNGCETDTSKDVTNCGGCGDACDGTNGTPKCLNGSCAITCDSGFGNCNAAVSDGCERATRNDVSNCGACGAVCAVQNGQPACIGTTCTVASCTAPFADCDHFYATGCEANTDSRIDSCGACGKACSTSSGTPTCSSGVCITP